MLIVISSICNVLQQCIELHVNTGLTKQRGHKHSSQCFLERTTSRSVYELKTNRYSSVTHTHTQTRSVIQE